MQTVLFFSSSFLQVIGVCFEVHDTWLKRGQIKKLEDKEKIAQLKLELKYEEVDPTPMDIFHYAFCYIGVLTGTLHLNLKNDDEFQSHSFLFIHVFKYLRCFEKVPI